jgi:autophagy-related protein 11
MSLSRSANASPVKNGAGSQGDLGNQSPTTSPRKQVPIQRKGSIWDSFFQYDITYQGGGNAKAKK